MRWGALPGGSGPLCVDVRRVMETQEKQGDRKTEPRATDRMRGR